MLPLFLRYGGRCNACFTYGPVPFSRTYKRCPNDSIPPALRPGGGAGARGAAAAHQPGGGPSLLHLPGRLPAAGIRAPEPPAGRPQCVLTLKLAASAANHFVTPCPCPDCVLRCADIVQYKDAGELPASTHLL